MASVFPVHLHYKVNTGTFQHIFLNHLLQTNELQPLLRHVRAQIWPSLFLMSCLVILVLIKISAFPKVLRIIQSSFNAQMLQQLEREEFNPFKFYSIALNSFFILNLSFLIYKINCIYKFVLNDHAYFFQFCFFLLIAIFGFTIKNLVNKALLFFTEERKVISEYVTNSTLVNQTLGLFMFPWIILLEFSKFDPLIFISASLIVMASALLLKWYRGIIMSLVNERIGLLQIFSYFCGLEILPVFVMVKYIIETF